ncbi:MAG: leucine-rich repeat protein [Paludibacteraceae bacterium]|nr:leucine-rich repeat protein [Paludibacteraceae bacterium]
MKKQILLILGLAFNLFSYAVLTKTVNVNTPGELANTLNSTDRANVTDLVITGTIDARDFKFMRDNLPQLTKLDLKIKAIASYTGQDGPYDDVSTIYNANTIPQRAFYNAKTYSGNTTLTSVSFSESLNGNFIPELVIDAEAFSNCTALTTLTVPSAVVYTSIGASAFSGCVSLDSISVPETVASIGAAAFAGCTNLKAITLPASISFIGNSTFSDCINLKSVFIPSSVSFIAEDAFEGCAVITELTTPFIKNRSKNIFESATKLKKITIPEGVTEIADSAFSGCSSYSLIVLPQSLVSIGMDAFSGCNALTEMKIPASVAVIGKLAFSGCTGNISVDDANKDFSSKQSVLYNKAQTTLIQCSLSKTGDYSIPSTVNTIEPSAFAGCSFISSVNIPASVTTIGMKAFYYYSGLIVVEPTNPNYSSIDGVLFNKVQTTLIQCPISKSGSYLIPSTVTTVGNFAFSGYSALMSVTIPTSVTSIGSNAFSNCSGLMSISIPSSVVSIGTAAFSGCNSLTTLDLPSNATSIGNNAFEGCNSITSIKIPPTVTSIGSNAFRGCSSLTTIVIPPSVTSIGRDAFADCKGLTSVVIPNSVVSIGMSAFKGCSSLASISIPTSVISIGVSAFEGCSSLTTFTIPNSITAIGTATFAHCTGLTSINIPTSVTSIGVSAFESCSGLTSINIPLSVTIIGREAFKECISLASVVLSSNLTTIGVSAFSGCRGLMTIAIPASVNEIGSRVFYECSGLISVDTQNQNYSSKEGVLFNKDQSVLVQCPVSKSGVYDIPTTVKTIGLSAFHGCKALTTVKIPLSVNKIEEGAFYYSNAQVEVEKGNSNYSSAEGILFDANQTTLISCPVSKAGIYGIPITVTTLETGAFIGCTALTSLSIPASVRKIGSNAFAGCRNLISMNVHSAIPVNLRFVKEVFDGINKTTCILYVPVGAKPAYKGTNQWKDFVNVVANIAVSAQATDVIN